VCHFQVILAIKFVCLRSLFYHKTPSCCMLSILSCLPEIWTGGLKQTYTSQDPFLELTGPSRAIALIDEFEVELRVIGSSPSEEKLLSAKFFRYHNNSYGANRSAGHVQTRIVSTKRTTIDLKYSHLKVPLEATIEMHHSGGSSE
jgi:hypothetical protein